MGDRCVRFGVIGAGGFGKKMIPRIQAATGCAVQALMVRDEERAAGLASEFGVPEHYTTVEGMLASPLVDAVYICTPDEHHAEVAIEAARQGKHILCEKPMALTTGECTAMIKACSMASVTLMPGFMMRFHPHHKYLRDIVQGGKLGQIVQARIQCHMRYEPNGSWRQKPNRGGGCLWDVGSHAVDLLCFFLGVRVNRVQGFLLNAYQPYPGRDSGVFVLQFENDAIASVDVSFSIPHSQRRLEIYGTEGTILCINAIGQNEHPRSQLITNAGVQEIDKPGTRYETQFAHFARCVLEGLTPEVTGQDGAENTRILEEMVSSSERNE